MISTIIGVFWYNLATFVVTFVVLNLVGIIHAYMHT